MGLDTSTLTWRSYDYQTAVVTVPSTSDLFLKGTVPADRRFLPPEQPRCYVYPQLSHGVLAENRKIDCHKSEDRSRGNQSNSSCWHRGPDGTSALSLAGNVAATVAQWDFAPDCTGGL